MQKKDKIYRINGDWLKRKRGKRINFGEGKWRKKEMQLGDAAVRK